MSELKKTPLFDKHVATGGRMVDFGGWSLPVQYTSVIGEHLEVRSGCGVFDTSHMGQIFVRGPGAVPSVEGLLSNNLTQLPIGKALYSGLLTAQGTFVDDLIAYKVSDEEVLLVVNAGNIEKDFSWISTHLKGRSLSVVNESEAWAMLAVQGPKAPTILEKIFPGVHGRLSSFQFDRPVLGKHQVWYARTGYTGENGAEVLVPASAATSFFEQLLDFGAKPCGLGSRDSLRLEKGYSLYGHEINESTNAWEAGLGWVVDMGKSDFVGKAALASIKDSGATRRLTGLVMEGRAVARAGYPVYGETDEIIGVVTSGTYSPTTKKNIALAYVPQGVKSGAVRIGIREERQPAILCKRNFSDLA